MIRFLKIPKWLVFVNEIGVLPAPVYNPHPGVLYVKSVYNPRVIHRKLRYINICYISEFMRVMYRHVKKNVEIKIEIKNASYMYVQPFIITWFKWILILFNDELTCTCLYFKNTSCLKVKVLAKDVTSLRHNAPNVWKCIVWSRLFRIDASWTLQINILLTKHGRVSSRLYLLCDILLRLRLDKVMR